MNVKGKQRHYRYGQQTKWIQLNQQENKSTKPMEGAEAREKQKTVTVGVGESPNLQKPRVSKGCWREKWQKAQIRASNGETKGLGVIIDDRRPS